MSETGVKASEGKLGRVFLIRLEEGDDAKASIEQFALEKGVHAAQVFLVASSTLAGIIAPDAEGKPSLRMPSGAAMDHNDWVDGEMVVQEVVGVDFRRVRDPSSGKERLARVISPKTRVMEKAAPEPEGAGPGTIPVYLFNAEFN